MKTRTTKMLARYAADGMPPREVLARGLCTRVADADAWHPQRENTADERTEAARQVCGACPVAAACLDYATARPWITGIWGGTTREQRRAIRTAAREAA